MCVFCKYYFVLRNSCKRTRKVPFMHSQSFWPLNTRDSGTPLGEQRRRGIKAEFHGNHETLFALSYSVLYTGHIGSLSVFNIHEGCL